MDETSVVSRWPTKLGATGSGWLVALKRGVSRRHHPPHERCGFARAQACQDGSSRYGDADAGVFRLVALRTGSLRMVAVPTIDEEDAKRPCRERETLAASATRVINRLRSTCWFASVSVASSRSFATHGSCWSHCAPMMSNDSAEHVPGHAAYFARLAVLREQIEAIAQARVARLRRGTGKSTSMMMRRLARIRGVGIETADMLVREVLSRNLRDRSAVARYAGLTGSPDESGAKRREKGLAKSGNARVRRGLIELAWRFLQLQRDSALAEWFRNRVDGGTQDHDDRSARP